MTLTLCVGFPRHGIVVPCMLISAKCKGLASIMASCFRRRTRTLKPTEGSLPAILGDVHCYFTPVIGYVPGVLYLRCCAGRVVVGIKARTCLICASTAEHIALHVFSPPNTVHAPSAHSTHTPIPIAGHRPWDASHGSLRHQRPHMPVPLHHTAMRHGTTPSFW